MLCDPIGNRVTYDREDSGTPLAYTANDVNQYLTAGSESLTCDLDGNLTQDGTSTCIWDAENRLKTVTRMTPYGGGRLEFLYDYMGRHGYTKRCQHEEVSGCIIYRE